MLADELWNGGHIRTEEVKAAFAGVPRARFVDAAQQEAADRDVPLKVAGSSVSPQPRVVARMLEQLNVREGQRVLEVGAASGYTAALLGALCGTTGEVISVDIDNAASTSARRNLATFGSTLAHVKVLTRDGANLSSKELGNFDRIIWSCACLELPRALPRLLRSDGVVVVPLILRGDVQKSIAFRWMRPGSTMRSCSVESVQFMPMRFGGFDDEPVQQHGRPPSAGGHGEAASADPRWIHALQTGALHDAAISCTEVVATDVELLLEFSTLIALSCDQFFCLQLGASGRRRIGGESQLIVPWNRLVGLADGRGVAVVLGAARGGPRGRRLSILALGQADHLIHALSTQLVAWERDRSVTSNLEFEYRLGLTRRRQDVSEFVLRRQHATVLARLRVDYDQERPCQ